MNSPPTQPPTGSPPPATAAPTRHTRVQQILDAAQGDTTPSYQGYGRFWLLPIAQFVEVVLYGVRLIAPATTTTDTFVPPSMRPDPPTSPSPATTRSSASGLIVGLRGEFPFDGSQFPRLPWGGSVVSDADIAFIDAWIADGCPTVDDYATVDDHATVDAHPTVDDDGTDLSASACCGPTVRVVESDRHALANGLADHPLSTSPTNEIRDQLGVGKVRKNIECLSVDELARLRDAIRTMRSFDSWAAHDLRSFRYWANVHANNCQHGWELFLPWHRMYLHQFEQQLQDIDPTVTVPYWDWPLNTDNVAASIEDLDSTSSIDNGVLPEAFRCWVDEAMLDRLSGRIPADHLARLRTVLGSSFNSANRLYIRADITFVGTPVDDAIMSELLNVNPLWNRNRWPGGNSQLIFEAYPTVDDVERVLDTPNFFDFGSGPATNHFFGAVENIHNLVHNFSGGANPNADFANEPPAGDMVSAGTTARDPIFWSHHSNVDRLWALWQARHPGVGPDDPSEILVPWAYTAGDVANIAKFGYEYLTASHIFETSPETSMTIFNSAVAGVEPRVVGSHRHAEIVLHGVRYATAGGAFIRVFVNQPGANAATPTRGNPHFVTQLTTFSGECLGGPGHCNPPPSSSRAFDGRGRHRKTPGNFRVDATETIRRLVAAGDTDFTIQLVVLGIDGQPKSDSLRLGAVSLNFAD